MKAYLLKPHQGGRVIDVNNTLEDLQDVIGGYIETLQFDDYTLVFDEEGQMKDLEPCCVIFPHVLLGNVLILRTNGEEFEGLTEEDIKIWQNRL